jgi:hypothetical protein
MYVLGRGHKISTYYQRHWLSGVIYVHEVYTGIEWGVLTIQEYVLNQVLTEQVPLYLASLLRACPLWQVLSSHLVIDLAMLDFLLFITRPMSLAQHGVKPFDLWSLGNCYDLISDACLRLAWGIQLQNTGFHDLRVLSLFSGYILAITLYLIYCICYFCETSE